MKFSVGLWDSLFGEKITIEIPDDGGAVVERQVTKRWMEAMRTSGKIRELPTIRVNMIHPAGNRVLDWVIGQNIDQQTVNQFRDPETRELYAITHLENGEPKVNVMAKPVWEKAKIFVDQAGEL